MPEACAIILAAGKSERMGRNKMLLPYHGKTMIRTVIDKVTQAGIQNILVILGAYREEMTDALTGLPVKLCFNADFEQGMYTSVQCGFRNMPGSSDAAVLFLGDQPMIPGEVITRILHVYGQSEKGIFIPVHRGKRGHPVLIRKRYAGTVASGILPAGLHTLFGRYENDIQEIETSTPAILRDIDTEQDYTEENNSNQPGYGTNDSF